MKREDSVKDIGALLDWIAKQPELDADRVVVTGGSYGGYMTLAVADALRRPHPLRRVDVVGISNFVTFLKNTESYRRDLRRVEYGDERDPEMRAFFDADRAAQQRAQDHEAAVRRAGRQRSARAAERGRADRRTASSRTASRSGT